MFTGCRLFPHDGHQLAVDLAAVDLQILRSSDSSDLDILNNNLHISDKQALRLPIALIMTLFS
jgi:hypothetical protein